MKKICDGCVSRQKEIDLLNAQIEGTEITIDKLHRVIAKLKKESRNE